MFLTLQMFARKRGGRKIENISLSTCFLILKWCSHLNKALQRIVLYSICGLVTIILLLHFRNDKVQHKIVMNVQNLLEDEIRDGIHSKNGEIRKRKSSVLVGEIERNCGLEEPCSIDSFPIRIYTGSDHKDHPRLCVNGHYVFDKDLNGAGRGMNIALIDSMTFDVLRAQSFDTYESDATQLEMFLEKYLQPKDIFIIFTFDEASNKLSNMAKKILFELGSGNIQNLKFRSSWYMVSQKGINGFTPYEKLSISLDTSKWANLIDERLCIPRKIVGQAVHPDAIFEENKERREFCSHHSGYGEFCSGFSANEVLFPAPLSNASMENHPIFSVPIAVLAGVSQYSLPMTLETIIRQPGINPRFVTVYYLPVFAEAERLAELFKFRAVKMENIKYYDDQIDFALGKTAELYPEANYMIFIDEELVLSPDFLLYMAQLMPLLDRDPTLYSISAWNDNGYFGTSSNLEAVYRVEGFPGMAFMISKATYVRMMKGNIKDCCFKRTWDGWNFKSSDVVEMVVPDVSRVAHRPYEGLGNKTNMMEHMFNRKRQTSLFASQFLSNSMGLIMIAYEREVEDLIKTAVILEMNSNQLEKCTEQNQLGRSHFSNSQSKEKNSYVLYFKQKNSMDYSLLLKLCKCFGLFGVDGENPRGLHKGMLRFTIEKNNVFLVGSTSPYFRYKPQKQNPLE